MYLCMFCPGAGHTDWNPSIVSALASQLDLNDVDSLSRTCRGVHDSLLLNRSIILRSSLHCSNEELPIDPESTLRYRARAGNWFYMEDTSRSAQYNGKSGSCARDMVAACRKCATVICRVSYKLSAVLHTHYLHMLLGQNCAIKPPAPAVLRDRHRRLCLPCQKSPIGCLTTPTQGAELPLTSHTMQRTVCTCATDAGVWLCQPCGRGIRGSDSEYRGYVPFARESLPQTGQDQIKVMGSTNISTLFQDLEMANSVRRGSRRLGHRYRGCRSRRRVRQGQKLSEREVH